MPYLFVCAASVGVGVGVGERAATLMLRASLREGAKVQRELFRLVYGG